ncbi:MAG: hypothetical protein WC874_01005 [Candidatus Izemoplasmatales bacterium]|jgi:hypothetical protein
MKKIMLVLLLMLSSLATIGCSANETLAAFITKFTASTNHQMVLSMYSPEQGFVSLTYQIDGNKTFTGNSTDPSSDVFTLNYNGIMYLYTQDEDTSSWVREVSTDELDSVFNIASGMVATDFRETGTNEFTLKSIFLNDYEMDSFVIEITDEGAIFTITADGIQMTITISEFDNISITLPSIAAE